MAENINNNSKYKIMSKSKWYLVHGNRGKEVYAEIREEETDLIVAEFPAVNRHISNERSKNLDFIVLSYNDAIKKLRQIPPPTEREEGEWLSYSERKY